MTPPIPPIDCYAGFNLGVYGGLILIGIVAGVWITGAVADCSVFVDEYESVKCAVAQQTILDQWILFTISIVLSSFMVWYQVMLTF